MTLLQIVELNDYGGDDDCINDKVTHLKVVHEDDTLLLRLGHEHTAATEETVLEQATVNLLLLRMKECKLIHHHLASKQHH